MQTTIAAEASACFLSYSRADEDFALRLANDLGSLGVSMWVDRLNIRPSEHWDRAIERAIRGCRSVVAVLSPRSVVSENFADEISLAINSGKPVIPVVMEPCRLPLRLTRMHVIDATRGYDAALKQCLAAIGNDQGLPNEAPAATEVARVGYDPEVLAAAEEQLVTIVGPIAEILVNRAAAQATSVEDLYRRLALHITDETERKRFNWSMTGLTAHASSSQVDDAALHDGPIQRTDVDRIAKILTNFLGPIAPILTKSERQVSTSVKDLLARLASRLSARERADFVKLFESE